MKWWMRVAAGGTGLLSLLLLGWMGYQGVPGAERSMVLWPLVTTLGLTAASLLLAVPVALGCAVRMRAGGNFLLLCLRTLAGLPSILYGLFGMLCFVLWLDWGWSLRAGCATLALMAFPLLTAGFSDALAQLPQELELAALGLGVSDGTAFFRVALPEAFPRLAAAAGVVWGRLTGESAALFLTAGTVLQPPADAFGSARTLAVHVYLLLKEQGDLQAACFACFVLVLVSGLLQLLSTAFVQSG